MHLSWKSYDRCQCAFCTLGPLQSMSSLQSVEYWHLSPTLEYFVLWDLGAQSSQDRPSPGTVASSSRDKRRSRLSGSRSTVFLSICHHHVRARPEQTCWNSTRMIKLWHPPPPFYGRRNSSNTWICKCLPTQLLAVPALYSSHCTSHPRRRMRRTTTTTTTTTENNDTWGKVTRWLWLKRASCVSQSADPLGISCHREDWVQFVFVSCWETRDNSSFGNFVCS